VDRRGTSGRHQRQQLALDGEERRRLVQEEVGGALRQCHHRGPEDRERCHRGDREVRRRGQSE